MRTTIDLPDPLFRRAKAVAALRGTTLKNLISEALERDLDSVATDPEKVTRVKLPLVPSKKPGSKKLSSDRVAELLAKEDLDDSA